MNVARAKRAEESESPVLVLTVDLPDSNREAVARFRRSSNPECQACHGPGPASLPPKPMIGAETLSLAHLDWDFVDRLRDAISMKLVIKGIVTSDTIDGRIPVICDSGFRRGTDIFKALAIGADAIAIGRPYLWGLAAFGQEGVEAVIDLLGRELEIVMRQAGVTSLEQIDRSYLA